jgi:hypothetical protein
MTAASDDALLTAADVMRLLKCSRSFVQDHRAELGARKLGGLLRFDAAAVQRFADAGQLSEAPAPAPIPRPRPALCADHRSALVRLHGPINNVTGLPWGLDQTGESPSRR